MKTSAVSPRLAAARRGFTLIELLTVIAIIGILAAIIIPVVGRVRQSAYASKSSNNLRQLAIAAGLYVNDNKAGYYPSEVALNAIGQPDYTKPWTNDTNFTRYFVAKLDPNNPWKPADNAIHRSGFPSAAPYPDEPGRATIGYNVTDVYDYSAPNYLREKRALRQSDIRTPSRLIMFAEAVDYKIQYSGRTGWTKELDSGSGGSRTDKVAYRAAGEKTIAVTYSGSVKMLSQTEADVKDYWSNFNPN